MLIKGQCYHTKHYKVWLENGIIYTSWTEDSIITLKLIKEVVKKYWKLTEGIARPLFLDMSGILAIKGDARRYLAGSDATKYVSAGAIYVDDHLLFLAAKVFIHVDEPPVPYRVFTERDSAMQWLELFK